MIIAVKFTINNKQYNGYLDNELFFDQKPLLEKAEALSLMNDINAVFTDEAEMTYDQATDNFYDDYRSTDDHSGEDYETEDGIKHLYDFAEDYFEEWKGVQITTLYKDDLGNLYYDEGLTENGLHLLVLVEEDNGHYTYTHNTWYEDADRLAELYTKIKVEVE